MGEKLHRKTDREKYFWYCSNHNCHSRYCPLKKCKIHVNLNKCRAVQVKSFVCECVRVAPPPPSICCGTKATNANDCMR